METTQQTCEQCADQRARSGHASDVCDQHAAALREQVKIATERARNFEIDSKIKNAGVRAAEACERDGKALTHARALHAFECSTCTWDLREPNSGYVTVANMRRALTLFLRGWRLAVRGMS